MIRPASFGFNFETAKTNFFQNQKKLDDVATKARIEFDAMVQKLKQAEIEVAVFDDIQHDLPDSVFSNNWMANFPTGNLTAFPMCTPNRRAEIRTDILDWIKEETKSSELIDLANHVVKNQFLEGTGSIVFDHQNKIAYACESTRTNVSLFESYCKQIDYSPISFQSFDLAGNLIYHTNVMMTIGNGFVLICLDSIQNLIERSMLQQKLQETNQRIIPISFQQMNQFAGNCIEVQNKKNDRYLLMSQTAFNVLTDEQKLEINKFCQILSFDIPTIETIGGGSVRCMITGLFR